MLEAPADNSLAVACGAARDWQSRLAREQHFGVMNCRGVCDRGNRRKPGEIRKRIRIYGQQMSLQAEEHVDRTSGDLDSVYNLEESNGDLVGAAGDGERQHGYVALDQSRDFNAVHTLGLLDGVSRQLDEVNVVGRQEVG